MGGGGFLQARYPCTARTRKQETVQALYRPQTRMLAGGVRGHVALLDIRHDWGLPHALPASIVGRCEIIVQGYTSIVATYTYIVTVDVTKPQPSQGVYGGVLLSLSLSPSPPPPLSSPLSLPPSLSLFDSRLHLSQGVYGGVLLCSIFATEGAYLMHCPPWWFTGPFYGLFSLSTVHLHFPVLGTLIFPALRGPISGLLIGFSVLGFRASVWGFRGSG